MGTWKLERVTQEIRPNNDRFGNELRVTFRMKYSTSRLGRFSEMPRLEWKETITMIEQRLGTYWYHVVDQYARDPGSQTFNFWVGRYLHAYTCVTRQSYGDASSKLYDKNGNQLPANTFKDCRTPKDKADAVRNYLKSKGGIMEVKVVDKPAINRPSSNDILKNRILTFDCGLKNSSKRIRAYQHLIVDGSEPETSWRRECKISPISPPIDLQGLEEVDPPQDVVRTKTLARTAAQGAYL